MTKKKGIRIPEFKNLEDERDFWDNVDLTELAEGELKPAHGAIVRSAKPLSAQLAIRLDADSMSILRRRAKQYGVGPTQLGRAWIMERLLEPPPGGSALLNESFEQAVLDVISRHAGHLRLPEKSKGVARKSSAKTTVTRRSTTGRGAAGGSTATKGNARRGSTTTSKKGSTEKLAPGKSSGKKK